MKVKRLSIKYRNFFYLFIPLFFLILINTGCATVRPYQRVYINDPQMKMGGNSGVAFEDYVQAIRTGSLVAGSKKASGGCGCN